MAYDPKIAARVDDDGKLVIPDPRAWRSLLLRHRGRDVTVTVKRKTYRRSQQANSYYWAVVVEEIAAFIGEDKDRTHEILKDLHCPREPKDLPGGKHIEVPPSTADMDVEAFSAYIERVKRWAADFLGLYIPDANETEVRL